MSLDRSIDRGKVFVLEHVRSQRAIKRQRTAAKAFRKPLGTHYRCVTPGGRELGDLCSQRTGESWKGIRQSVAAICSDASSVHFIYPFFFFNQSILTSPLHPLRCPHPLPLTPASATDPSSVQRHNGFHPAAPSLGPREQIINGI